MKRVIISMALTVSAALSTCIAAELRNNEAEEAISYEFQNKESGETITAELISTLGDVDNRRFFVNGEYGNKMLLDVSAWRSNVPAELSSEPITGTPEKAVIIPIEGPIESPSFIKCLKKTLEKSKRAKYDVIVFRINSARGLVTVSERIIRLIEKIYWAPTVAWIHGDNEQALSCGAQIAFATHRIYMAPTSMIGAAGLYSFHDNEIPEVKQMFDCVFPVRLRGVAERRGHSTRVVDAMVDRNVRLVQGVLKGKEVLVTREEADILKEHYDEKESTVGKSVRETIVQPVLKNLQIQITEKTDNFHETHYKEGDFTVGKIVSSPGEPLMTTPTGALQSLTTTVGEAHKPLTMTARQALKHGICHGIAADKEALAAHLGLSPSNIHTDGGFTDEVEKETKKKRAFVREGRIRYDYYYAQANKRDPMKKRYTFQKDGYSFADFGERWRFHTDRCLKSLKECSTALKDLEKLSQDERFTFGISEKEIEDRKVELEVMHRRLKHERSMKGFEPNK